MNRIIYILLLLIFAITYNAVAQNPVEKFYLRKGNAEYKKKDYEKARVYYLKANMEDEKSFLANLNLGDALYQKKDYNGAAAKFDAAAKSATTKLARAKAYYNLGNAQLKANRLQESINAYKDALRNNPNDANAKYNLSFALKKKKEKEKEKPKQDKKDNKKDKDQKDNKKDKDKDKSGKDKDKPEDKKDKEKDQKKNDDKKDKGKPDPKDDKNKDKPKPQPSKGDKKTELSEEEAQRILNAIRDKDKEVQKRLLNRNKENNNPNSRGKQW